MQSQSMHRFVVGTVVGTLVVSLLGLLTTATAKAATTVYTDQSAFEAALATSYLETFTTPFDEQASFMDFASSGFGYRVTAPSDLVYEGFGLLSAFSTTTNLVFTATSGNYTAIGGNFYLTDDNDFVAGPITLATNDGTSVTFSPTSATVGSFRGFISTVPITTLTMGTAPNRTVNTADNIRVGTVRTALNPAAPEPGSLALLLSALGTVGMVLRKRRRYSWGD